MRGFTSLLVVLLGALPLAAMAADAPVEPGRVVGTIILPTDSPLYPNKDDRDEQPINMSGLFCPEKDWCLMVSDELHGVHRLKVARDADNNPTVSYAAAINIGVPSKDFRDSHGLADKMEEFDLEAIAASADEVFFFGSHANKRNKGTVNPGSHLVAVVSTAEVKTKDAVEPKWLSLDGLFKAENLFMPDNVFRDALNVQLQCGGLNIEGATISGSNVLIGLRAPSDTSDKPGAYVISVPLKDFMTEEFGHAVLHLLPTGQPMIGVRSMETVDDGVVVITGDAGTSDLKKMEDLQCASNLKKEDADRLFQLRLWKPAGGDIFEAKPDITFERVKVGGDLAKLEAIAADPARPGSFFILYDGDDKVRYLEGVTLN